MVRRSTKLPPSSGGPWAYLAGELPIPRLTIDWQEIEREYGKPLSAEVRKTLLTSTEFFVWFEESERTGIPVAHVRKIIETCRKRASEFQEALSRESGEGLHAISLIGKSFEDPRPFAILDGLLISFQLACKAALQELEQFPSLKEGDEWDSWIRRLTRIVRDAGLVWKVSKDDLRISPFVALVRELQKCLPARCRRHTQSDSALAAAISRARRGT